MHMLDLEKEISAVKKTPKKAKKKPSKKAPTKRKPASKATRKKESDALKKVRKTGIKKDGTRAKYKKAKKKVVIKDTGEKIGGARKDRAKRAPKTEVTPPKDDTPAWKKRFAVREIDDRVKIDGVWTDVKRWQVFDTRRGRKGHGGKALGMGLETEAQAQKAAAAFAAHDSHVIMGKRVGDKYEYTILRKIGRSQHEPVSDQTFQNYNDASTYLIANAEALLARKPTQKRETGHGEEMLATPDKVVRKGPAWRKTDAKPEQFVKKFHMRGIEFGNWQGNRQTVLNNAYDALSDMADVLKIDPSSLFFDKKLGLAFGARGRGGKGGARAHYEPDYMVMNLTKKQGAGSLAHEWWHAVDHMLGQVAMESNRQTTVNSDGHTVMSVTDPRASMASHMVAHSMHSGGEMPADVTNAYRSLMETIFETKTTKTATPEEIKEIVTRANDSFNEEVKRIRDYISQELPLAKRFKRKASSEELRRFDEDVHILARGGPESGAAQRRMGALVKSLRGKTGESYINYLGMTGRQLERARIKAEELAKDPVTTTSRASEFVRRSRTLDRGRTKPYWTLNHELAARAFSAYVEDKLEGQKRRSDYLSFGSNGTHYANSPANPFPEGDERKAINEKFDALFDALRKTGTLKPAKGKTKKAKKETASAVDDKTRLTRIKIYLNKIALHVSNEILKDKSTRTSGKAVYNTTIYMRSLRRGPLKIAVEPIADGHTQGSYQGKHWPPLLGGKIRKRGSTLVIGLPIGLMTEKGGAREALLEILNDESSISYSTLMHELSHHEDVLTGRYDKEFIKADGTYNPNTTTALRYVKSGSETEARFTEIYNSVDLMLQSSPSMTVVQAVDASIARDEMLSTVFKTTKGEQQRRRIIARLLKIYPERK